MYEYRAEYLSNYDGDTIKFMVDLGFGIHHMITVRLAEIDTPELRSSDPEEKARAYEAKDFVREALMGAENIIIRTEKDRTGKYGRYIAHVSFDGVDLKEVLLNRKLGELYQ